MGGSNLIYKCRMCGRVFKGAHVPDGTKALAIIMSGAQVSEILKDNIWDSTTVCNCNPGTIAIADLIGIKEDAALNK